MHKGVYYETRYAPIDVLNAAWKEWHETNGHYLASWNVDYNSVTRTMEKAQQFEDWLYEQGAYILQIDGQRYISFGNDDVAVMFMLKYKR